MKTCFLSIDVESASARSERASADKKEKDFEGVENLDNILNIFKKHGVKATLFVTGEVLEYAPDLVKKWSKDFEIGCHNYWHVQLDKIDLAERERQVEDFVNLYKRVFGYLPKGFRAPRNIIDNEQFPILEKYGFLYDASVFPRYPWRLKRYEGYKGKAPILPYWPDREDYRRRGPSISLGASNKLLEIPESTVGFSIPLVGTWLRKLGIGFYKFLFILRKPEFISFSMHSWDGVEFEGKSSKNSGKEFLKRLDELLKYLKKMGYEFLSGIEILEMMHNKKGIL
jgi:peptidoglycan/xylan/chitin deacetylase (PgdA/CDA1 family)